MRKYIQYWRKQSVSHKVLRFTLVLARNRCISVIEAYKETFFSNVVMQRVCLMLYGKQEKFLLLDRSLRTPQQNLETPQRSLEASL